jgi:predicted SAM-dependent methyltransferase
MKLNLGCGGDILPGYINADLFNKSADIIFDAKKIPFKENCMDEILSFHLIEHFDFREAFNVLKEWHRVLKFGGKLILETPDFLHSCESFVKANEQERVNLYGHFFAMPWIDGQVHKFLYTESQLQWTLSESGFKDIKRVNPTSKYVGSNPKDLYLKMECIK